MSARARLRIPAVMLLAVATVALAGCAPSGSESEEVAAAGSQLAYPPVQSYPQIRVTEDVQYGIAGTEPLLLDVCHPEDSPTTAGPRSAVISVHGGSWRAGDKASAGWRSVCQWLASEGFVAFSINYRLAPVYRFPAQIEDVRAAVRWLRQPEQVSRYHINPLRIGAFGGSAGGNLVALLGLEGTGELGVGSRVAAVVDLSGPTDLTESAADAGNITPAFRTVQRDYLGCASLDCQQARAASPLFFVDESDPPFFVANSTQELIPLEQSDALVAELRDHGVDTTYVTVTGGLHSIALLDDELRTKIAGFLRAKLG